MSIRWGGELWGRGGDLCAGTGEISIVSNFAQKLGTSRVRHLLIV